MVHGMTNRSKRPRRAPLPEFLTTDEVADMLAVDPSTVRRWIEAGRLPACKPAGGWRILRSDVEAMLRASSTAGRRIRRPLLLDERQAG